MFASAYNEALCLTRLKFTAILKAYKRDEKNILSGIRQLNKFDTLPRVLFGGTFPTPPTNR